MSLFDFITGGSKSKKAATKQDLLDMEKRIMASEQETLDAIDQVSTALTGVSDDIKATGEQLTKALAEIQTALNGHHVPGTVTEKLAGLANVAAALKANSESIKTVAKTLDDLNPDEPTPPAPPAEPPAQV